MIDVRNIVFAYRENPVVDRINFRVSAGEFVGIIGANGAGKSTLLKLIAGMLRPLHGEVRIEDTPVLKFSRRELAKRIAFVGQQFSSTFDFTVREIVAMGRFPFQTALGSENTEDRKWIESAMQQTEVIPFAKRVFLELSGGEQQRVVLASALCQQPRILLLDEPTAALDLHHQQHFFDILTDLQKTRRLTVISVTHDINLAIRYSQRIIAMKNGAMLADDSPENLVTAARMREVYGADVAITQHPRDGKPLVALS